MKNKFLVLAGTVLVLTLGSCVINYDTEDENPSEGREGSYSISGKVSISDQSEKHLPAGTRVELRQGGAIVQFVETAVGANGVYTLTGVEPGTYTLEMAKEGYYTGTISGVEVTNANVTGKDITLLKAPVTRVTYTISGTISTSDKGSAEGAEVQLMQSGQAVGSMVFADANGLYSISGAAAGDGYTIEAYLDGYDIHTTNTFTVSGKVTGKNIELSKAANPTYSVHGVVSLSDGKSPEGVHVHLKNNNHEVVGNTSAGANGAYNFTGVEPGDYIIEVSFTGYTTHTSAKVTVSSANVTATSITLAKAVTPANAYTVSGTISVSDSASGGSPKGAYVQLQKEGVAVGSPGVAAADGTYSISEVVAGGGPYTIEASLDGYTPSVSASSFTVSGNVTGQNLTLTKIAAAEVTYTVSGTISLSDGKPGAGARVRLLKDGEYVHTLSVGADDDGYYSITQVKAGDYTIGARLDGYVTNQTASFTVSGDKGNINLTLEAATYSISGTITTSDGVSAQGADVQLRKGDDAVGGKVSAGTGGAYTISEVKAGTYSIEVNHSGYNTATLSGVVVSTADITVANIALTKTLTRVSLNPTTLTLISGQTAMLTATITPSNAADKTLTWTSSNAAAATVDGGVVTAVAAGTATITARTVDGQTASCDVTVSKAAKTITQLLDGIKTTGTANTSYTINLEQDETAVEVYEIGDDFPDNVTITIDGTKPGGGTYTVGWTGAQPTPFYTSGEGFLNLNKSGATLVLKNVTFEGILDGEAEKPHYRSLVSVGDGTTFKMQDGAVLTKNHAYKGGGVHLNANATFEMSGGAITGNKTKQSGGGVSVAAGASITMSGGTISGNEIVNTATTPNDVALSISAALPTTSLTMSGAARIGVVHLAYVSGTTTYSTITINGTLTGESPVATIDISSSANFNGKQILKGDGVATSYDKFVTGYVKSVVNKANDTPMGGTISSSGVWTKD